MRDKTARGGNWPPGNDKLVADYLTAFSRFFKSMDIQNLI